MAGNQLRVFGFAHANRHVKRLAHQIDPTRGKVKIEFDVGVVAGKSGDDRRQISYRKIDGKGCAQHAAGLREDFAQLLVGKASFIHDALAAVKVNLPRLGQFDLARRAMQQAQTDGFLQGADAPRQRGIRYSEDFCRAPKTLGFDHFHKQRHVVQEFHIHCSVNGSILSGLTSGAYCCARYALSK